MAGRRVAVAGRRVGRARLTGVDVARSLALVGMAAVHIMPDRDADGSVSLAFHLASGRASALFAVLAGVGIALATGGPAPRRGVELRAARRALAARAGVVAAVGLTLGMLDAPVAVILTYYGVLFLTAIPVLAWSARRLAALAVVATLAAPVVSMLLRFQPVLARRVNGDVVWAHLAQPGELALSLLLTGYYPVLTWTAYLSAGMAVGRCALERAATAAAVAAVGGVLAGIGLGVHHVAVAWAGGWTALGEHVGLTEDMLRRLIATSMSGTTPVDSWWWLLLAGRHSGSGPDLLHTGGSALLVLGVCLLAVPRHGPFTRVAAPAVAVGATSLTLYTAHVIFLGWFGDGSPLGGPAPAAVLVLHVAGALLIALAANAPTQRGPLEALAAAVSARAARSAGRSAAPRVSPAGPAPPAAGGDEPP